MSALDLGAGVTTIEPSAFSNNDLTELTIPDQITAIAPGAFSDNQLTSITLSEYVTTIGQDAFSSNDLTEVTIPASVTSIESWAFGYNAISSVTFEGPAPAMGPNVFADGRASVLISFPWRFGADVVGAGGYTTPTWTTNNYPTQAIATVEFDNNGGTPAPADQDVAVGETITEPAPPAKAGFPFFGWYLDVAHTILFDFATAITGDTTLYAHHGDIEYTYDPANVAAGATAHAYHGSGGAITIPDTIELEGDTYDVIAISNYFAVNRGLTAASIGGNVTRIGNDSFYYNQLTELTIPDNVMTIGLGAFDENQLASIDLGAGLTRIGVFAFANNQLTELTLPATVSEISSEAFSDNPGLASVAFTGAAPTMDDDVFGAGTDHPDLMISFPWRYGADVVGSGGYTTPTWTPNQYPTQAIATVEFRAGAGSPTPDDQFITAGGTITEPAAPALTDHVFLGWYDNTDFLGSPFDFNTETVDEDLTLFARYGQTPTINGSTNGTATVGELFAWTPTITGNPSVEVTTTDALPDGLTLDPDTGAIAGTPTGAAGSYQIELTATNAAGATTFDLTITVEPGALTDLDLTASANDVSQGDTITITATGTDSAGNSLGDLTSQLVLASDIATDVITNNSVEFVTAAGTHTITGTINGVTDTVTITVTHSPAIDGEATETAPVGETFEWTPTIEGFPAPTVTADTLPDGLEIDATTGIISGTPTGAAGDYLIELTATNTAGTTTFDLTITVEPGALVDLDLTASSTDVNQGDTITVTATGTDSAGNNLGDLTNQLVIASDIDSDVISGNNIEFVTAAGSHTITGTINGVTEELTITVTHAPVINGTNTATATVDETFEWTPTIEGFPAPTITTTDTLPDGLEIDATTGIISGTPTDMAGDYLIELTATNAAGATTFDLTITVEAGTVFQLDLTASAVDVSQGDTITVTATGVDAGGNDLGDLSGEIKLSSDVATDIIDGNTVTFPTASPHTITATHTPTGVSESIVIEVTPAASTGGTNAGAATALPATGTTTNSLLLWAALAALATGVALLRRQRSGQKLA